MTKISELELLGITNSEKAFVDQVRSVMEVYFATDVRRIAHAHDVAKYASQLLKFIDADPLITLAAAYLHDIGIPEAERKFGRCDGRLQEQEGPPIARMLLADIGTDDKFNTQVCQLVGLHHTPAGVDSPEFRILWDADALVNLRDVVRGKDVVAIESILHSALVTEPGFRMARELFLRSGSLS